MRRVYDQRSSLGASWAAKLSRFGSAEELCAGVASVWRSREQVEAGVNDPRDAIMGLGTLGIGVLGQVLPCSLACMILCVSRSFWNLREVFFSYIRACHR